MTTRAALRAGVIVSIVGISCRDPAEPSLPTFSVSPATQWSGGTVTVRSSYFVNPRQAPTIIADGDTLSLTSVDDSTVSAVVPEGPSGSVVFSLARGTRTDNVATVVRVGYNTTTTATSGLDGLLEPADSAGKPIVFGAGPSLNGYRAPVVRLTVATGQTTLLALRQPDKKWYGMAPSITPGVWAVRDSTDSLRLARLLDDVPVVTGSVAWIGTGGSRQLALLSDSVWLLTESHYSQTRSRSGFPTILEVETESPYRVFMSPRGDRTTLATVVTGVEGGVPVFDNATGMLAYRLPFIDIRAVAFPPDGATMFVAGGNQYNPDTLVALNATTGTVQIPKLRLPGTLRAMGLAYRSSGGELLVGAADTFNADTPSTLYLLVYRASTLQLLGVLPSSYECGKLLDENCMDGALTVDNAQNRAYIVVRGSPATIVTFDLLGHP